jgi:preprotein translocase subunit SecF
MKTFDIISKRIQILCTTLASFTIALLLIIAIPLNKSIEFTGGAVFEVFVSSEKLSDFQNYISSVDVTCASVGGGKYIIKTSKTSNFEELSSRIASVSQINSSSVVAPSMTSSLIKKSVYAIIFSVLTVFIYILIRFNTYYSFGAIITIVHDLILSMAFIKIMHIEFGISTIAALLTIVGYSVNDTVIVYDKIRASLSSKCNFKERLNQAINSTLPRTVGTSLTTILAILPIIFFTSGDIKYFCEIVVFGIFIGTISSIAVSALFLLPFEVKILEILKIREQSA